MTSSSPDSLIGDSTLRPDQANQKMRDMVMLPEDFEPTKMDVVIGRGKKARSHEGNNRLRGLIEFMIPEYTAAGTNKDEKSYIIKEIVTQIRKSSPDGGFVKFDKSAGRWFEVGDFLAREKISQTFRDAMGDSYSSSNPYKRKRRSFEKKNSAVVDTVKRRRGSSPTSVVPPSPPGASSAPSPPSPGPITTTTMVDAPPSSVTVSPPLSPPQQNPALSDIFKRPGEIGFARGSMLRFGMAPGPAGMYARSPPFPMVVRGMHPNAMLPVLPGMHPLRQPLPHFIPAAPGMPPRRVSMPGAFYSPALMADMMHRQHMVRNAALLRRPSAPAQGL